MKKILLLIVFIIAQLSLHAQNWTKDIQKDFHKSNDVAVVVDLTKATICGVSYDKFPSYYAQKVNKEKEYVSLALEQISNTFISGFRDLHDLPIVDVDKAKYVVHYDFKEISDDGGFNGRFYVMCGDNKSAEGTFRVRDGRWNDFETLVKENIQKYFGGVYRHYALDPYVIFCLYKYKK